MNRIKCLIIDDEPSTASILESYIKELDSLELVGTFYNAVDALMYLQQNKIDLLFLDIMLPKVTGDAFLKMLPSRPRVIFLSNKRKRWSPGSDEYILGCLSKPVAFEEFLKCIDRCYAAMPPVVRRNFEQKPKRTVPDPGPFVYLFSGKSAVKIFLREVLYIEGVKNFSKIKTAEREIIVYQGLAAIEARLFGKGFMRIHRSLLVAVNKVTGFSECTIEIGTHILPVSAPYRGQVGRLIREGIRNV